MTLAVLYALAFERLLPGPRWLRGAVFSLLPWVYSFAFGLGLSGKESDPP